MPLIYSQATVTITASRSMRVDEGFFQDRTRMAENSTNLVFKLPFQCSSNQLGSVVILPKVVQSTELLDLRGWDFQERFLSPRILEYGSIQTRWICQSTSGLEFLTDGYKASHVSSKERQDHPFINALKAVLGFSNLDSLGPNQCDDPRSHWHGLVEVYTNRALT
jgi:hypothetical protein